ncbi:hypothetical protein [Streptomyces boluensis]|uniref:Secreted protein n=1 Tax=Streptomyces boluensis TaxID=1775135 RepID=A0A964XLP8_9ACTN|nr:hypothetical protein [Streptomyces boluensis]NBE53560.1 hypothetical protein [Streptomyces boluensis]
MPRGRHRHSPPLHRLLPPSTVAGASLVCAAAAWLVAEPVALRVLTAGAAAATVVGAVVMRRWDRLAGKRVAELTRARASDEWKHDERTAELESDLDESREVRAKLEVKLRSKRAELAALRSEHAALLRRYATAETERASALEGRRRLAIEASAPAKALPPGGLAARTPSPALYLRANAALDHLSRNGAVPAPRGGDQGAPREGADAQGKPGAVDAHPRTAAVSPSPRHYPVPAAAAVVPHAPVRRTVAGGFDFFGTQGVRTDEENQDPREVERARAVRDEVRAIENKDLADVVGEEALALHLAEATTGPRPVADAPLPVEESGAGTSGTEAEAGTESGPVAPEGEFGSAPDDRAVGEVIDLTAHDETEQLDVADLRSAIS